jgi:flagellar biosynthesis/type III secretory pathway chaperone
MEKQVREFQDYLLKLLSSYNSLGNLLSEEREILIKREVQRLEKITEEKQKLLNQIEDLEKEGYKLQKDLSCGLCKDNSVLPLREICNSLPSSYADKFHDLRFKLKLAYNKIVRINKVNSTLIKKYLDFSSFYVKKMQTLSEETSTYSAFGKLNPAGGGISVLFQKKV